MKGTGKRKGIEMDHGTDSIRLFRREAIEHRRVTWLGSIVLVQPISFTVLIAAALAVVAVLISSCLVAEYTKKARVSGYLMLALTEF